MSTNQLSVEALAASDMRYRRSSLACVTWRAVDLEEEGPYQLPPTQDAFQITIDLVHGGRRRMPEAPDCSWQGAAEPHAVMIADLAAAPTTLWATGRFEVLDVLLERSALDGLDAGSRLKQPTTLACRPGTIDPVIGALAQALTFALREPVDTSAAWFDELVAALVAKVVATYSVELTAAPRVNSGLAPWQERRAKGLFTERLNTNVPVSDVARACKLSRGHFTKSFKETTGQSPHAWVTSHRVGAAMSLMRTADSSLADVSLACGFSDQSHFTRVFRQVVGETPGAWQRLQSR